jgi:transcription elongation GreA/GreB family factor
MAHLNDAKNTKDYLSNIKTNVESRDVVLGSIVKTNMMNFYISTSIGKIDIDDEVYYAISVNSPIGQLLKNKTVNERFEFNQNKYIITEII